MLRDDDQRRLGGGAGGAPVSTDLQVPSQRRFFIAPERLARSPVELPDDIARQVRHVLRLGAGDRIELLDGHGRAYVARLLDGRAGRAELVAPLPDDEVEPRLHIMVALALLRGERFEWALQKCTELGAVGFIPLIARRTVVQAGDAAAKLARWQRIVREAAEQSRRRILPHVFPITPLARLCSVPYDTDGLYPPLRIALWEGERERSLSHVLHAVFTSTASPTDVLLVVGPEGGFDPSELEGLRAWGALTAGLGRRVLRAETAAVLGTALTLALAGELG